MFPYSGDLAILRSANAYSVDEVALICATASAVGLRIIPLIPTLSNLEFLLKHRRFSYLREVPNDIRVISGTHPRAVSMLHDMIDQVLALHHHSTAIHLGGHALPENWGGSKVDQSVLVPHLKHARKLELEVFLWDDLLREWDREQLEILADSSLTLSLIVMDPNPQLSYPHCFC